MDVEELKWRQVTHNQLMSLQGPHFSAHSTHKSQEEWHVLEYVIL